MSETSLGLGAPATLRVLPAQFAEYFGGGYKFAGIGLRGAYPHLVVHSGEFAFLFSVRLFHWRQDSVGSGAVCHDGVAEGADVLDFDFDGVAYVDFVDGGAAAGDDVAGVEGHYIGYPAD